MKSLEKKGKSIEIALNDAMQELGIQTLDNVDVEILKHPGVFSQAIVKLTLKNVEDKLDSATPQNILSKLEQRAKSQLKNSKENSKSSGGNKQQNAPKKQGEQSGNAGQTKPKNNQASQQVVTKNNQPVKQSGGESKQTKPQNTQQKPQTDKQQPDKQQANKAEHNKKNENKPSRDNFKPRNEEAVKSPELMKEAEQKVTAYLTAVLGHMGVDTAISSKVMGDGVYVQLADSCSVIIGHRGEGIEALEYLSMQSVSEDNKVKVYLDCAGFREARKIQLIELARNKAAEAIAKNKRVRLDNMNSLSRKIVHSALSENTDVITKSEGRDPNRYLVIMPKNMVSDGGDKSDKSGKSGSNNNKHRRNNKQRKQNKSGAKTEQ